MSVDLVISYRTAASKDNVKQVSNEYTRLVQQLRNGGLWATGKKGEKQGKLLIFVHCPEPKLVDLARTDDARAFVHQLSTDDKISLSPAEQTRLIVHYVSSSRDDGGLGITPGAPDWSRVESIIVMHDQHWNDNWIKTWSTSLIVDPSLDRLRAQFGESVAMYFAFLWFYTRSLVAPALLGVFAFFHLGTFSHLYSAALLVWSVVFVEWWRIKERKLAVKWRVKGAANVETLRAEYVPEGDAWWKRELKVVASVPVIIAYAILLIALMTLIFALEAFVTQLYTGPGHQYIGFAPTVLFVVLVPRLLAFYHAHAVKLTEWENHQRQSSYDRSLTLKSFALSAIVAYGGLALSAFVYVPFGSQIMHLLQSWLSSPISDSASGKVVARFFKSDSSGAQGRALVQSLKGVRLRNQVFAYTVTNQVINFVQEVIVPWVLESVQSARAQGKLSRRKKRVEWEDEPLATNMSKEDRQLLDAARAETALPEYQIFNDYSEMVTQFGYVAIWSTCWPLAPVMALINNWVELRSDAFKIAKLGRRPLPSRAESIGAWLHALSFLTWLGALVNSALVSLFNPSTGTLAFAHFNTTSFTEAVTAEDTNAKTMFAADKQTHFGKGHFMIPAVVIALLASHGHIVLCSVVRHVLERALWRGSAEETILEEERQVETREATLRATSLSTGDTLTSVDGAARSGTVASDGFWADHGLDEINSLSKLE